MFLLKSCTFIYIEEKINAADFGKETVYLGYVVTYGRQRFFWLKVTSFSKIMTKGTFYKNL